MKIKVSEATPIQLDWLVAKCEEHTPTFDRGRVYNNSEHWFTPTTAWVQGGPIIEREKVDICHHHVIGKVSAIIWFPEKFVAEGIDILSAAMRCYVASKLGEEIEIPTELT